MDGLCKAAILALVMAAVTASALPASVAFFGSSAGGFSSTSTSFSGFGNFIGWSGIGGWGGPGAPGLGGLGWGAFGGQLSTPMIGAKYVGFGSLAPYWKMMSSLYGWGVPGGLCGF